MLSLQLKCDEDVVQDFGQLRNVFAEAAVYSDDMFFVFMKFGNECDCMLQFKDLDDCVGVYLHTAEFNPGECSQ